MRMRAFKSHGMNRIIARGTTHMVNDIGRKQSYNQRLRNEVYATDDDTFYNTYSTFPRHEIKNRYILQRLREIEIKRNGRVDTSGIGTIIAGLIIFVLIMSLYSCSNM